MNGHELLAGAAPPSESRPAARLIRLHRFTADDRRRIVGEGCRPGDEVSLEWDQRAGVRRDFASCWLDLIKVEDDWQRIVVEISPVERRHVASTAVVLVRIGERPPGFNPEPWLPDPRQMTEDAAKAELSALMEKFAGPHGPACRAIRSNSDIAELGRDAVRKRALRERLGIEIWQRTADQCWRSDRMPQSAHKRRVAIALLEGRAVPACVLADYPDLCAEVVDEVVPHV